MMGGANRRRGTPFTYYVRGDDFAIMDLVGRESIYCRDKKITLAFRQDEEAIGGWELQFHGNPKVVEQLSTQLGADLEAENGRTPKFMLVTTTDVELANRIIQERLGQAGLLNNNQINLHIEKRTSSEEAPERQPRFLNERAGRAWGTFKVSESKRKPLLDLLIQAPSPEAAALVFQYLRGPKRELEIWPSEEKAQITYHSSGPILGRHHFPHYTERQLHTNLKRFCEIHKHSQPNLATGKWEWIMNNEGLQHAFRDSTGQLQPGQREIITEPTLLIVSNNEQWTHQICKEPKEAARLVEIRHDTEPDVERLLLPDGTKLSIMTPTDESPNTYFTIAGSAIKDPGRLNSLTPNNTKAAVDILKEQLAKIPELPKQILARLYPAIQIKPLTKETTGGITKWEIAVAEGLAQRVSWEQNNAKGNLHTIDHIEAHWCQHKKQLELEAYANKNYPHLKVHWTSAEQHENLIWIKRFPKEHPLAQFAEKFPKGMSLKCAEQIAATAVENKMFVQSKTLERTFEEQRQKNEENNPLHYINCLEPISELKGIHNNHEFTTEQNQSNNQEVIEAIKTAITNAREEAREH